MTTRSRQQDILDQISRDIRHCADALSQAAANWPAPERTLEEQLWELSQSYTIQLELAAWDAAHGYAESAAACVARARAIKVEAQRLRREAR